MDTLKKGSKGEVVKWYQRCLVELGYDIGKAKDGTPLIDGIYGTEVVSATRAFQYDNGLPSDGMAGKKTLTKVKELMDDDEPDEDTEVDFDAVVEPLTIEERVKRLEQAVFGQEGGESDGP
jgi:peptidoglycan hydrolase-like protein with peptidoglycan-binding domain